MKKFIILIVLIGVTLVTPLISHQQADIELPTYTLEQRWERASDLYIYVFALAIAHAKSLGQSVEEATEDLAKIVVPTWGEPGSGTLNIIRGMYRNHMALPDSEFKITESSDVSVTARYNRSWAKYFGEEKILAGITLEEFETCVSGFYRLLAEYLGLGYKSEIKEGWFYMTFSKKK
jgi:hypothetical protein